MAKVPKKVLRERMKKLALDRQARMTPAEKKKQAKWLNAGRKAKKQNAKR